MAPDGSRQLLSDRFKTWRELVHSHALERTWQTTVIWQGALAAGLSAAQFGLSRLAGEIGARGQRSCPFSELRNRFGVLAVPSLPAQLARYRRRKPEYVAHVEDRLTVLKPYINQQEPGVVHVKFSETISELPRRIDIDALTPYYRLVLEPSWTGLCDPGILQYLHTARTNIILAPDPTDYALIEMLAGKLVPIGLGPCDWVDPRIAEPHLGAKKEFDIVMNSNWSTWKRHGLLFNTLRSLPASTRIALIGGAVDGTNVDRIIRLARYFGVAKQVTIFERISHKDVMRVVCAARCSVLLSLKEGANRSLAESMFCDVPVLLLNEHVGGIRKNVVPETGVLVPERQLASGLMRLIEAAPNMNPRAWALENIACSASSACLNDALKAVAANESETWSEDIVVRANSPEATYYSTDVRQRLAPSNELLKEFVRGRRATPI